MKVLLLGASGQLGTSLFNFLKNHEILNYVERFKQSDKFYNGIKELDFDVLINCVALHDLGICEEDNCLADSINTEIPSKLSEICEIKKKKFIHFSTDYVFDGKTKDSYSEDDTTNPLNYYAISKQNGEKLILKNNNSLIFRVSSLFGKRRNKSSKNFVEKILDISKKMDNINMVSDQIMNPTSVKTIGKIFNDKFEAIMSLNGIYHLCNKEKTSWFEFTKFIFDELKLNNKINPINYKDLQSNINRPLNSSLNTSKIEEEIDIKIESWKIELKEYLNGFK